MEIQNQSCTERKYLEMEMEQKVYKPFNLDSPDLLSEAGDEETSKYMANS